MEKRLPLFSIGYRREDEGDFGRFCPEPTILMTGKNLMANRRFPPNSYVTENTARSSLALKSYASRTHDLHGGKELKDNRHFPPIPYVIENRPRSSLAPARRRCQTHDLYELKWVILKQRFFDSLPDASMASLNIASALACG